MNFIFQTENIIMFPIIPQRFLLHQTSPVISLSLSPPSNGELRKLTSPTFMDKKNFQIESIIMSEEIRVLSAMCLPKNAISVPFSSVDLIKTETSSAKANCEVHVKYKNGLIHENTGKWNWIKSIRLANDFYSNNCILELTMNRKLQLRIVRDMQIHEELVLWFSEEIIHLISLPHLSPMNIQGQNKYCCHKCLKVYENPNPLKIHLFIGCTNYMKNSIDILWSRLNMEIDSLKSWISTPSPPQIITTTTPSILSVPTISTINSSVSTKRYPSAFQPILATNKSIQSDIMSYDSNTAASNLETIVSNMGTSKQGHLCIYCGKLYSRKYGLKIHIRTHTGFKPLKCKYCFRPFGDPSNLNKHIRLHAQNNCNYKCNLCNKILIRRRDLERHIQTKHAIND